jgi:hypothetical protein
MLFINMVCLTVAHAVCRRRSRAQARQPAVTNARFFVGAMRWREAAQSGDGVARRWGRDMLDKEVTRFGGASFQSLRDVGERHGKSLDGREGVLKVERVSVGVDPAKLHHLDKKDISDQAVAVVP